MDMNALSTLVVDVLLLMAWRINLPTAAASAARRIGAAVIWAFRLTFLMSSSVVVDDTVTVTIGV